MINVFQNMFAMKLNSIKNSKYIKMADFPVLAVCSVKRKVMHTSHTLCRLAPIYHHAYPYLEKKICLCIVKSKSQHLICELEKVSILHLNPLMREEIFSKGS